jgi:hypothetical protein
MPIASATRRPQRRPRRCGDDARRLPRPLRRPRSPVAAMGRAASLTAISLAPSMTRCDRGGAGREHGFGNHRERAGRRRGAAARAVGRSCRPGPSAAPPAATLQPAGEVTRAREPIHVAAPVRLSLSAYAADGSGFSAATPATITDPQLRQSRNGTNSSCGNSCRSPQRGHRSSSSPSNQVDGSDVYLLALTGALPSTLPRAGSVPYGRQRVGGVQAI